MSTPRDPDPFQCLPHLASAGITGHDLSDTRRDLSDAIKIGRAHV